MAARRGRLSERRTALGYSQEKFAEAAGVATSTVVRWETGRSTPLPYQRAKLAGLLQVTTDGLAELLALDTVTVAAPTTAPPGLLCDEEDVVDRRGFTRGAVAITAGAALEPWGRLAAALDGRAVDQATVDHLLSITASSFEEEEHIPARLLAEQLSAHVDRITAVLPNAGRYRAALTIAAGESAALAGWTYWDQGDYSRATHYYRTARLAATYAGHGPLHALVLGYASYGTNATAARTMLAAAQQHVRGRDQAAARAWLAAREAEEAAAAGARETAVGALGRAETAFDYADPEAAPAWMSFFGRARLGSMAVSTYARLRHHNLDDAADQTLADLGEDDRKVRVAVLGDVAAGYLAAGSVDQAVEVGRRALAATLQAETTMGHVRLSALADQLPDTAAAGVLREEIRAAFA